MKQLVDGMTMDETQWMENVEDDGVRVEDDGVMISSVMVPVSILWEITS